MAADLDAKRLSLRQYSMKNRSWADIVTLVSIDFMATD